MTTQNAVQNQDTLWLTAFTPAGFKVSFTLVIDPANIPSASYMDSLMTQAGYSPHLVELDNNTSVEEIDAVVRSVTSKGDTVIYCYRQSLEWKIGQLYFNSPADLAAFEQASGLKVDSLPIYEGQGAPQRKDKLPTKWERPCRPFKLTKTLVGVDDKGMNKYRYGLFGHSSSANPAHDDHAAPAPAQASAPQSTAPNLASLDNYLNVAVKQAFKTPAIKKQFMERAELTADDVPALQKFLGVKSSISDEFVGTVADLFAQVTAWRSGASMPF